MATAEKLVERSRSSWYRGQETAGATKLRFVLTDQMDTSDDGCGNVTGFSTSRLKMLNRAVFAPIATAMVSTATNVKPGVLSRERRA
jgi:hypothetical protein